MAGNGIFAPQACASALRRLDTFWTHYRTGIRIYANMVREGFEREEVSPLDSPQKMVDSSMGF